MTPDRRKAICENMFPGAHDAIYCWDTFSWHTHATSRRSSQMLAIDVFGSLKVAPQAIKDKILARVAEIAGVPRDGPWQIHLEWFDPRNLLNERTPTQVDAVAISDQAILLFECKFTEAGGGCSQIVQRGDRPPACNGNYEPQINPQSGVESHCALSGKAIAYWQWIERVYGLARYETYRPCPFASDAYQWMRNTVLAAAISEMDEKKTRVLAVYADASYLQTAAKVKQGRLGIEPLRAEDEIVPLSYDQILQIACEQDPGGIWPSLSDWVDAKVKDARPA